MTAQTGDPQGRILSLIDYLEAYDARWHPPVYDIARYGTYALRETDLPALPGIHLTPGADTWLAVDRKTTLCEQLIAPDRLSLPFVNADRIARDRFPGHELEQAYEASTIAARTRTALMDARLDYCTETVFSHESEVDLVVTAVNAGYEVVLHAVMIPLELSAARVAARVVSGGQGVPNEKLGTRCRRLWPHVATAVPHCYRAVFYDNSADDGPYEVASYRFGIPDYRPRWPDWTPDPMLGL